VSRLDPGREGQARARPCRDGNQFQRTELVARTGPQTDDGIVLAERLAARAEQRGLSFSDLVVEYAQDGMDRADGT
jgi:hypothetical protein